MAAAKDCTDPCQDWIIGGDKEIVFQKGPCLATDNRLIWDYDSGLLTIDGNIAVSGIISTSNQIETAYLSLQALGLGSMNFTPESGYGGLVYSGGSVFYYWNDLNNAWEQIDYNSYVKNTTQIIAGDGLDGGGPLTGDVYIGQIPESTLQLINVNHNGNLVGTRSTVNFQDSVSVSWEIDASGSINVNGFGTGGGQWIADVNAGGFCIQNLGCINGIQMQYFLTNPWDQDVNANGFNLYYVNDLGVNNLAVGNEFIYQDKTLEQWLAGADLWTLAPDGSIYRDSDVRITGPYTSMFHGPLEVVSTGSVNYLYVDIDSAGIPGSQWSAFGAKADGDYVGEIGFNIDVVEIWTTNLMIMQGDDATGSAYFPGNVGINTNQFDGLLTIVSDSSHDKEVFVERRSADAVPPQIYFWKNRGTSANKQPVVAGDSLMYIGSGGWLVGVNPDASAISTVVTSVNSVTGDYNADLVFSTRSIGSPGRFPIERFRINALGNIIVNGTGIPVGQWGTTSPYGWGEGIRVINGGFHSEAYDNAGIPSIYFWRTRGSLTSPTNVIPGDWLLYIGWGGMSPSFPTGGADQGAIKVNVVDAQGRADFVITTNDGTDTVGDGYERFRITSTGQVNITGSTDALGNGPLKVTTSGGGNPNDVYVILDTQGNPYQGYSGMAFSCGGQKIAEIGAWNHQDLDSGLSIDVNRPGGSSIFVSINTGYVGINMDDGAYPKYQLDVVGDINCSGSYRINGQPLVAFIQDVVKRSMRRK